MPLPLFICPDHSKWISWSQYFKLCSIGFPTRRKTCMIISFIVPKTRPGALHAIQWDGQAQPSRYDTKIEIYFWKYWLQHIFLSVRPSKSKFKYCLFLRERKNSTFSQLAETKCSRISYWHSHGNDLVLVVSVSNYYGTI